VLRRACPRTGRFDHGGAARRGTTGEFGRAAPRGRPAAWRRPMAGASGASFGRLVPGSRTVPPTQHLVAQGLVVCPAPTGPHGGVQARWHSGSREPAARRSETLLGLARRPMMTRLPRSAPRHARPTPGAVDPAGAGLRRRSRWAKSRVASGRIDEKIDQQGAALGSRLGDVPSGPNTTCSTRVRCRAGNSMTTAASRRESRRAWSAGAAPLAPISLAILWRLARPHGPRGDISARQAGGAPSGCPSARARRKPNRRAGPRSRSGIMDGVTGHRGSLRTLVATFKPQAGPLEQGRVPALWSGQRKKKGRNRWRALLLLLVLGTGRCRARRPGKWSELHVAKQYGPGLPPDDDDEEAGG